MANTKVGSVISWRNSSDVLAVFRLVPEEGNKFPDYRAGQYIALRRDDCRLTKKVVGSDGKAQYETIPGADGKPKRGRVTHSYSIASAPYETLEHEWLEFYVILEIDEKGVPGRLTESMFRINPKGDNKLIYFDKIAGEFTLEKRAKGFQNVVFVGTGTGLAPFISMVKQLDFEASQGKSDEVKYTLIHANRTYEELDYREELIAIESAQRFNFLYIPSVSRPTDRDRSDPKIGKGRANNLLRHLFEMPAKEEQDLQEAAARGEDTARAEKALEKTVMPVMPSHISRKELEQRLEPPKTVIITCGNPWSMEDIKYVADTNHIQFEKEDW